MHYRPRKNKPKVVTPKYEIDYRLLDLLEIQAILRKKSKNKIFEAAILKICQKPSIAFCFQR